MDKEKELTNQVNYDSKETIEVVSEFIKHPHKAPPMNLVSQAHFDDSASDSSSNPNVCLINISCQNSDLVNILVKIQPS